MSDHQHLSSSARKERIFEMIRGDPAPTRRALLVRSALVLALGLTLTFAIFVYAGGLRAGPRPTDLIVETTLGAACIAGLAFLGVAGRGGTTLGRARRVLLMLIVAIPILLFAWKLGWSASHPEMTAIWPERPGFRCLKLSLSMGVGPLLALMVLWRDRDPVHPAVTGAALGTATGAFVWVLVDLWCPVGYAPHLLLGHVLPLVVFAVAGAILGLRFIALKER